MPNKDNFSRAAILFYVSAAIVLVDILLMFLSNSLFFSPYIFFISSIISLICGIAGLVVMKIELKVISIAMLPAVFAFLEIIAFIIGIAVPRRSHYYSIYTLFFICIAIFIFGIILGFIALRKLKPEDSKEKSVVISGMVLSVVFTLVSVLLIVMTSRVLID
jgi:hypothetical protein